MIIGVGVDMVKVIRIEEAIARFGPRFLARCFTEGERSHCRLDPVRLAARFAAKEAVAKALGTGLRGFGWRDIEVAVDALGRPLVSLHGQAEATAQRKGVRSCQLSLSHDGDYALAFAIASGEVSP